MAEQTPPEVPLADHIDVETAIAAEQIDDEAAIAAELEKLSTLEENSAGEATPLPETRKTSTGFKVFLVLLTLFLLAAAGAIGWVLWTDYQATDIVPEGVTFNGKSMAGLTSAQAQIEVANAVGELQGRKVVASLSSVPATSTFRTGEPTTTIDKLVEFNPEASVNEIVDARAQSDILTRVRHDFLGEPIVRDVTLIYSINETSVADFVSSLASHYESKPVNAKITQKDGAIALRKSSDGYAPDITKSTEAVSNALLDYLKAYPASSGDVEFDFAGEKLAAKTPTEKLEKEPVIVVSLSNHRVTLFNGEEKIKSYPCAIGTPSHPTPVGNWKIVQKRRNPVWRNPGSEWAKDMPASIGPSADSPLGLRALNLDAANIRLHGTTNIRSVGTAASHGCLRMYNGDIIDLFDRVNVGTKVFIIR